MNNTHKVNLRGHIGNTISGRLIRGIRGLKVSITNVREEKIKGFIWDIDDNYLILRETFIYQGRDKDGNILPDSEQPEKPEITNDLFTLHLRMSITCIEFDIIGISEAKKEALKGLIG